MSKAVKVVAIVAVALLLVAGASLVSLYVALQRVPEFYRDATARQGEAELEARDRFVAEVTALASDLHRRGRWQRLFTAEAINAWLALQLADDYPDLLEGHLHDPRIELTDHQATIACRYENGSIETVLSLVVDAYLQEPNVLALRIRGARAGSVPVPLGGVLDSISHAAAELKLRLQWRKSHGDPVALITFGGADDSSSPRLELQHVEIRDGELYLAGSVGVLAPLAAAEVHGEHDEETADEERSDQPLVGAVPKDTRQE